MSIVITLGTQTEKRTEQMARKIAKMIGRERMSFRLPSVVVNELRSYCDRNGLVMTSVLEDCLKAGLAALKEQEPSRGRKKPLESAFS